ncbi:MAG TPA: metalloregulator ArsR/SmtB family transcription factor [Anaerolineae bacterium]|nr:metalloregulator ArsR/SmtB family transcription factor [Anaerolineae bacterium]
MTVDCVEFCRALADETRQHILVMLQQGERCVGDIVDAFGISQPAISHHLGVLKRMGLVTARKQGKLVYYALNRENVVMCCGRLMARLDAERCPEPASPSGTAEGAD